MASPSTDLVDRTAAISSAADNVAVARRNETARTLLREWLSDTSGYDEEAWSQAKKVIEENRLSPRSRFDD